MQTRPIFQFAFLIAGAFVIDAPFAQGDFLYVGARSLGVTRVEEVTANVRNVFATGFYRLDSMTLGPDGTAYVSAINANDGQWAVHRFDPTTGQQLGTFLQGDLLDGIRFGPDGKFYGVNEWTGDLMQYNGLTGARERTVLSAANVGYGIGGFILGFHDDVFVATSYSSKFARYDLATGQQLGSTTELSTLGLAGYGFDQMTFAPDGQLFVAYSQHSRGGSSAGGGVMRFDPSNGSYLDTVIDDIPALGAANGGALGLAFGPDGDLYVGSQQAYAAFRYDPVTWNLLKTIPLPGLPSATYIRFLPVPEPAALALVVLLGSAINAMRSARFASRSDYPN